MLGILQNIGGWFELLGTYFVTGIKGFGYMLAIVIESLYIPPLLQPYLPTFFISFMTAVTAVAVIKGIFGR